VRHYADASKFQAFGKLENRATSEQYGEGRIRRERRCVAASAAATQAGETLRPMMRSPDRSEAGRRGSTRSAAASRSAVAACYHMDGAVGELGQFGELRLPGHGEAFVVGLRPLAFAIIFSERLLCSIGRISRTRRSISPSSEHEVGAGPERRRGPNAR